LKKGDLGGFEKLRTGGIYGNGYMLPVETGAMAGYYRRAVLAGPGGST
jgi:hypothetical protein